MWVLVAESRADNVRRDSNLRPDPSQSSGVPESKWGLIPGHTLTVGRHEGDINNTRDSSMSKSHAKFTVIQGEGSDRPRVILEDVGSKFGTFLNNNILQGSQSAPLRSVQALKKPYEMKEGDRVRFGVGFSIYNLTWIDLHVTSSMLKNGGEKKHLEALLKKIDQNNTLESNMSANTSHLVMESIAVSIKVVNCLARGIPIVVAQYFRDLIQCLNTQQKLPDESGYLPPVAASEVQLRDNKISFAVNPQRAVLFRGLTFVFLCRRQFTEISPCCRYAGGEADLWINEKDVKSLNSSHVIIKPTANWSANVWESVSSMLSSQSRTAVSQTDIFLAIVYCSTESYCNTERWES